MSKLPSKILIVYCSVGSGHRVAAGAIEEALAAKCKEIEVSKIDALSLSSIKIDGNSLSSGARFPVIGSLYDLIWDNKLSPGAVKMATPMLRKLFSLLEGKIIRDSPHCIVCTHALGSLITSALIRESNLSIKHVGVLTDFRAHSAWPVSFVDKYCASSLAAKIDLIKSGINPGSVEVTGIPLRGQFSRLSTAGERIKIAGQGRVLVVAGAFQSGAYSSIAKTVLRLMAPTKEGIFSASIICGRDKELKRVLESKERGLGQKNNIRILGFVDNIFDEMLSSDLLITKPGGLLCAEAVAAQTPLLLFGHSFGQERANAEYLVNNGVAFWARNEKELLVLLPTLLKSDRILSEMRERMGKICPDNSSELVTSVILETIKEL